MQHVSLCPHCGQPWQQQITNWDFSEWRITTQFGSLVLRSPLQVKVFDLLWRKQGIKGITRERLIEIIYIDDLNGGPSLDAISQMISRLRKNLISVGIYLQCGQGQSREGYSLVFMTPEQARKKK